MALLGLLAILVVSLGCLLAFLWILRRRSMVARAAVRAERAAASGNLAGNPGVVDPMVCPSCRREFEPGLRFCPRDATRLVPAPLMLDKTAGRPARTCPRCHRAFTGTVRFCPHDGSDLVPAAMLGPAAMDPAGLEGEDHPDAKICPACRGRYGYAETFCGKDGIELVVLN